MPTAWAGPRRAARVTDMIRDLGIAFFACLSLGAVAAVALGLICYRRAYRADPWSDAEGGDPG